MILITNAAIRREMYQLRLDLGAAARKLVDRLLTIERNQNTLMTDVSGLSTAFTKFATDFGQFRTDFTAFLAQLPKGDDPSVQVAIDGFTSKVNELDTAIQEMDATLKPAPSEGGTPVA